MLTISFGCLPLKMKISHLNNQVETLLNTKPLSGSGSKSINIYMTRNKYHHSRAILWVLRGHLWAWLPRALPSFLVVSWFSLLISITFFFSFFVGGLETLCNRLFSTKADDGNHTRDTSPRASRCTCEQASFSFQTIFAVGKPWN